MTDAKKQIIISWIPLLRDLANVIVEFITYNAMELVYEPIRALPECPLYITLRVDEDCQYTALSWTAKRGGADQFDYSCQYLDLLSNWEPFEYTVDFQDEFIQLGKFEFWPSFCEWLKWSSAATVTVREECPLLNAMGWTLLDKRTEDDDELQELFRYRYHNLPRHGVSRLDVVATDDDD